MKKERGSFRGGLLPGGSFSIEKKLFKKKHLERRLEKKRGGRQNLL